MKKHKVSKAGLGEFSKVDMFDIDINKYPELIKACRFYYKKDPVIASVVNRLADMAATDIIVERGNLRVNEFNTIKAIVPQIKEFIRNAVKEALISGLVYPEVDFKKYNKDELRVLGIKIYNQLILPEKIWLRNPESIIIKPGLNASDARYFMKIPTEYIDFINSGGKFSDGTVDKELYDNIKKNYPDLVKAVKSGQTELQLHPKYSVLRKDIHPNSPYPSPYLSPVLEQAAYKRNLRRMDYATASRVITAIMLVKLGSDKFPLTEEDSDAFDEIEAQLRMQQSISSNSSVSFERIIQLFADHTLNIEWIYPPLDALLNEKKYDPINQEILIGLGFPMSAIIGESIRSNSGSDTAISRIPEIIINPIREALLRTTRSIIYDIINMNKFRGEPGNIRFEPINMESLKNLVDMFDFLFSFGNLSRQTLLEKFGFDFKYEMQRRAEEDKILESKKLTPFPATPHSNTPPPPGSTETNDVEEQ